MNPARRLEASGAAVGGQDAMHRPEDAAVGGQDVVPYPPPDRRRHVGLCGSGLRHGGLHGSGWCHGGLLGGGLCAGFRCLFLILR